MPALLSRTGWSRARRRRVPLPAPWTTILEQHVAYYRVLPSSHQAELRGLVQVLMGELSFEAGAGLEVVDEATRLMIAAQAGLLLLHRPLADLPKLRTAIVYPGVYRVREQTHTDEGVQIESSETRHGEAWSHGVLLLSGEDVRYDSTHIDDGENVVLHEVAHALDDQTGESDGMPLLADAATVDSWKRAFGQAFGELDRDLRQRRKTLLDPYAAEDPAEFFAVATEAFFELPVAFQAIYPELYRLLRELYRLDPVHWAHLLSHRDVSPT